MAETGIPNNDPLLALQKGMEDINAQRGPLDFNVYAVDNLAEVEVFLFAARGADGKSVSGILFRPLMRPDQMFAVTDMSPVSRDIAMRINARLPAPRKPQPAPPKQPQPVWRPEPVLPPTPGQASAPSELLVQGEALVADAARRREAMIRGPQGQPVTAPGSVPIEAPSAMPIVLPSAALRAAKPRTQDIPPDIDENGVEQG